MSDVTREQLESAIGGFIDPYLEKDLVSAKSIKHIAIDAGKVSVDVVLGYPARGWQDELAAKLKALL